MTNYITKITIYNKGKFKPERPSYVDLNLQFKNPNQQKAMVTFSQLTDDQKRSKGLNCFVELPKGEIQIDATDQYLAAQSETTANTNVKAQVAVLFDDQDFVYKKSSNFVVLILKLQLPLDFNPDEMKELVLGFNMVTKSQRHQEPFSI